MADGGAPLLALYRRYRPDTFEQVVGQDHVVTPLTTALSRGRVNHAYLFSGPRGCGKTTSARVLARCLNCVDGPTATPCGQCPSCVDLANGGPGSLDVIEIDAASHRGIDDARDLRDRVTFAPVRDPYKVVIIDEAHQITSEGFNALLKVVEEPPEHVVFLFATTEPEKVLGTIRSRTHHYPFRLVPPARLMQHLEAVCRQEGVTVDPAALSLVVRAGAGSVRDSMSVLDQLIAGASGDGLDLELATALLGYVPESLLDDLVDALAAVDGAAAFAAVHHAVESGHDPRRYTNDLLERLRTLVIVSRVGDAATDVLPEVPEDAFERLRHQASRFGHAELSRAADVVAASLGDMAGATSPRLLLELLVARLLVVGADADGGVRTRVDRLERQLTALTAGGAITAPAPGPSRPAEPAVRTPAAVEVADRPPAGPAPDAGPPAEKVPAEPQTDQAPPAPPAPQAAEASSRGPVAEVPPAERGTSRPAAPAAPTGSAEPGVTVEVVRRTWDQVVDRLRTIRRLTWTLVSENAQVLALDGSRLTLGFPTQGLADAFNQRGHSGCVQEAVLDTLGVDREVVGVTGGRAAAQHDPVPGDGERDVAGASGPAATDPPSDPPSDPAGASTAPAAGPELGPDGWPVVTGPAARPAPPSPAPAPAGHDRATARGGDVAPGDGTRAEQAERHRPDSQVSRARAREGAPGHRPTATPGGPGGDVDPQPRPRVEPVPPPPAVDDVVSRDDPSADEGSPAHGPEVLARLLGATVIEERPTNG